MQSLNDDMDELFRRAAENYPLNTDGADWDKVLQHLQPSASALPEPDKKKKNYRFLWLLLLLPLGFFTGKYVGNNETNHMVTKQQNKKATAITTTPTKKTGGTTSGVATLKIKETTSQKSNFNISDNKTTESGSNIPAHKIVKREKLFDAENKSRSSFGKNADFSMASSAKNNEVFNKERNVNNNYHISKKTESINDVNAEQSKNVVSNNSEKNRIGKSAIDKDNVAVAPAITKSTRQQAQQTDTLNAKKDITEKTVQTDETKAAVMPKKNTKEISASDRRLYYTLTIGPDFSSIKKQHISNVGYSVGILLGYKVHKNIAIEVGALWDYKRYYTTGEYFNTSKLANPSIHIIDMYGNCNMIEIPVNVKYDFATKKNQSWFVAAGISSYLMHQEDYNYTYERNNMQYQYYKEYNNSSRNWFSIMNFSIGYQKTIGKYTNIRIEPYVKLPLNGVGFGSLPITSTGIYLGLSRSVH